MNWMNVITRRSRACLWSSHSNCKRGSVGWLHRHAYNIFIHELTAFTPFEPCMFGRPESYPTHWLGGQWPSSEWHCAAVPRLLQWNGSRATIISFLKQHIHANIKRQAEAEIYDTGNMRALMHLLLGRRFWRRTSEGKKAGGKMDTCYLGPNLITEPWQRTLQTAGGCGS